MSNSINLAALGFGGIDTSTLVSSLVNIEQQPMLQLEQKSQQIQSASTTISSFSSTLSGLSNAASALSNPTTFAGMSATSSDPAVVATASGKPVAGTWSVSVQQIAQAQQTMSNGYDSTSTALGLSGQILIDVGGQQKPVSVSSTDTLSDIASAISATGLPVQTSMMYDGKQFHLLVSGQATGDANAITFDESGLTVDPNAGPGTALGLSVGTNTLQPAQDAVVTLSGAGGPTPQNPGLTVSSASNQFSNLIPGVTLAVKQPTTTAASVTIASDSSALENQVQSFVTAYNSAVSNGHSAAGFGKTAATNSLLQGDTAINSVLDQLGQLVAATVPGTTGNYTTLSSVGITLNDDGTLAFDQTAFDSALQADPAGVEKLFVTDSSNGSTGIMSSIQSVINTATDPTSGGLEAEINAFGQRTTQLNNEVQNEQRMTTAYQTQLQNEFSQMNAMLAQYKQIATSLNSMTNSSNSNSSNGVI